ncbi:MAG TPA: acyltransferase [Sphingomonadaceae bacterium]|nr:acyltransferase [Sphingomonadaceae bacterium]
MNKHWPCLDGLRGVLALAVVFLHFDINILFHRLFGMQALWIELAVDVFFLLSGFVLTHSVRNGTTFRIFAAKRLLRLMPVYYITTLAAVMVVPALPRDLWAELLVAGPFFLRNPVNFPAWSICFELYLPLLAVLLPIRLPQKLVRPALVLALLGCGICMMYFQERHIMYAPRAIFGLAAGHLLYRAKLECRLPFDLLALGVIALILAAGFAPPAIFVIPFAAAAAILAGTRAGTMGGGRLFSSPPAQWLGSISYTLYLVHAPVLYALGVSLGPAAGQNPVAKLAGLAASLILATVLTKVVERPAMALSARLFPRNGMLGTAA